ncbi:MAG: MoaD/ThiS family protein [Chloroflexi bacterium]|nr:MoaD/ThiS family protein [Chloroflexota bacterium]
MTRVTVKFTGEMWARAGIGSTEFTFEGATLDDLLTAIFARYDLRDLVFASRARDQFVFRSGVLINGRSAKFLGGLSAPICEGDEVILMRPAVAAI